MIQHELDFRTFSMKMKTNTMPTNNLSMRAEHSAEDGCLLFANAFPGMLKELRIAFKKIQEFFQTKDDNIDIALLDEDLLYGFKDHFGCQLLKEMLKFYLEEVLPKAQDKDLDIQPTIQTAVSHIGEMLFNLKQKITLCQNFFACSNKSRAVKRIKETYNKLQEKGVYKAMGELDIFIDYIEDYLIAKKK
ncbi:interleukin-10 [Latimeria chalumnae]|uniref:interleukin-10 n=1 Tax=Latimeria chalumnae TaxID=7897 RepID=UPI00313E5FE1